MAETLAWIPVKVATTRTLLSAQEPGGVQSFPWRSGATASPRLFTYKNRVHMSAARR